MANVYDNWGRLVGATLKREELRRVAREDSLSSSFASDFDLSFRLNESAPNFQDMGFSFTEQQIIEATGNFSNKNLIKHGDSGDLFIGSLEFRQMSNSGQGSIPVVIKIIDSRLVNGKAYTSELEHISKLSRSKPCPLLGHCWDNKAVKFVVYSLSLLDWNARIKIAIRVAKGLEFLHYCNPPLVHGDIRTCSVFLDGNWEEQIESITQGYNRVKEIHTHQSGITRNSAKDTLGIMIKLFKVKEKQGKLAKNANEKPPVKNPSAGELRLQKDTPEERFADDVYCFGMILLELVTGNLGASELPDSTLQYWLRETLRNIEMCEPTIIDPKLMLNDSMYDRVGLVTAIARRCLHPETSRRPHMDGVRKALENPHFAMFGNFFLNF